MKKIEDWEIIDWSLETGEKRRESSNHRRISRSGLFSRLQSPVSSLILAVFLFTVVHGQDEYVWQQIFNGVDLEGWNLHMKNQDYNEDPFNTLRVADGILHVDYSDYTSFDAHYMHFGKDDIYSNFILGVEYRFVGEQLDGGNPYEFRNSGILFHSEAMSEVERGESFPRAIEAQTLQRGGDYVGGWEQPKAPGNDPVATLNLCPIKTNVQESHNCNSSGSHVVIDSSDAWIRAEVHVLSDSIGIFSVNGEVLSTWHNFEVTETGEPLTEGTFSFQAESHPIDFRKIEVVNLVGCMDETANNYKDYFVVPDEDICDYTVDVNDGNLTNGEIQFDRSGISVIGNGPVTVDVYDIVGKRILSEQGRNTYNRSFTDLGPGLFLVRASVGDQEITGRVVRLR